MECAQPCPEYRRQPSPEGTRYYRDFARQCRSIELTWPSALTYNPFILRGFVFAAVIDHVLKNLSGLDSERLSDRREG